MNKLVGAICFLIIIRRKVFYGQFKGLGSNIEADG